MAGPAGRGVDESRRRRGYRRCLETHFRGGPVAAVDPRRIFRGVRRQRRQNLVASEPRLLASLGVGARIVCTRAYETGLRRAAGHGPGGGTVLRGIRLAVVITNSTAPRISRRRREWCLLPHGSQGLGVSGRLLAFERSNVSVIVRGRVAAPPRVPRLSSADGSRRRRGCRADSPWTGRGAAAAVTRRFGSRRPRAWDLDCPWTGRGDAAA